MSENCHTGYKGNYRNEKNKIRWFYCRANKWNIRGKNWLVNKKEEWLISVNSFFKEMDGFLEKYISENKVSIVYDSKNLIEDYVGEYF